MQRRTVFISIHAPRTGSDALILIARVVAKISIHAPRTGSDARTPQQLFVAQHFNPRSPHGERPAKISTDAYTRLFQSTLPARGATPLRGVEQVRIYDFNPRSPHGERHGALKYVIEHKIFQSTLPARGATNKEREQHAAETFQSTLPARGATGCIMSNTKTNQNFNPRSPHGERQVIYKRGHVFGYISIHAPRTGSDRDGSHLSAWGEYFNPRSPHGERLG